MKKANPLFIVGLVFAIIGMVFLVPGGTFLVVSRDLLPELMNPDVWLAETPDELALPVIGVVFTAIGAIFAAIGFGLLIAHHRRMAMHEELLRFGLQVQGMVTDIRVDRTIEVNGRHPLRIMVQAVHPVTGETLNLKGPRVWEATLSTGDAVAVYFDPQNDKRFTVQLPGETA